MIKLIHFSYEKHKVGDVVDLGEEKNRSMVALGRAVFVGEDAKKYDFPIITKPIKHATTEKAESTSGDSTQTLSSSPTAPQSKKLLQNKLQESVQQKKPKVTKSIWDRLK